jgi:dCTP deaminase
VLVDWEISEMVQRYDMIRPFQHYKTTFDGDGYRVMSYGLDADSYDVRAGRTWRTFKDSELAVIDPLGVNDDEADSVTADVFYLKPHGFCLVDTLESFALPPTISGLVFGKSSYARLGIIVSPTALKRGWHGDTLVLEISNQSNRTIKLYAGQGIGSLYFFHGDVPTNMYRGQYHEQRGVHFHGWSK